MALATTASAGISSDVGAPDRFLDVAGHYLRANRPWLTLYGLRVRPALFSVNTTELALIQRMIPDELMLMIFAKLDPDTMGCAGCVCSQWRVFSDHPIFWQRACLDAFRHIVYTEIVHQARFTYRGSWKRMFLEKPHLRFNGVYIARNTYIRTGIAEWRVKNPVHLVAYFRYVRFFPDGTMYYRTTPDIPNKVVKSLQTGELRGARRTWSQDGSGVLKGKYRIVGENVYCVAVYPNSRSTEFRIRLRIRSTLRGAHNRLDIVSIVTRDGDGVEQVVAEALDPELDDEDDGNLAGRREHRRGMSPFVFFPWEKIDACPFNLPIDKMDFYVCG